MAESWEQSIKDMAKKLADTIRDATELTVITRFKPVSDNAATQAPVVEVKSEIKLDQDSEHEIPVTRIDANTFAVQREFYDIHKANVDSALEYRAKLIAALVDAVKTRLR